MSRLRIALTGVPDFLRTGENLKSDRSKFIPLAEGAIMISAYFPQCPELSGGYLYLCHNVNTCFILILLRSLTHFLSDLA